MKIAQVAPLYESVPPKFYGGTERIVSYLTDELVKKGHSVTLFASADSVTNARLIAGCEEALRLCTQCTDMLAPHVMQLQMVQDLMQEFDIVHYHTDYLHYPLSRMRQHPQLTTLHGRLDLPELQNIYREYNDMPVVSISNDQRKPVPFAYWIGNVYHGLPTELYHYHPDEGKYLAFLGRISPEKGLDKAMEIAKRTGIQLKIAAKINKEERDYYEKEIAHSLHQSLFEFLGEIGEKDKDDFLGNALCVLFPIDWPEPFGLVMIEAMACGTPVIAYQRGSVPEVIDNGQSGYIVNNINEAVKAVNSIHLLSRKTCREIFEDRFTVSRMTEDYLGIYKQIIEEKQKSESITGLYGTKK